MCGLKKEDIQHLACLRGSEIIQVRVGLYQLDFMTTGDGITVEGRCELLQQSGDVIDVWQRGERSREFRFLELIGKKIQEVEIDTPRSFVASFVDGSMLRVVDDSDEHESFSVGGLYV